MMRRQIAAAAMALLLAGCVAQTRITGMLRQAGLSPASSHCIAHRLTAQLSVSQLRQLAKLHRTGRSADDDIAAVQRLNDGRMTRVVIGSAALCIAGLER